MSKAVNYAWLRYCPFPDTGEFANVGVVTYCPQDGALSWRMITDMGRVSAFFGGTDTRALAAALRRREESLAFCSLFVEIGEFGLEDFREMTRPREGMLTLGPPGAITSACAKDAVDELFKRMLR